MLIREKYTGDVVIADSGGSDSRYLNKNNHEGGISKEQFEAVKLEMELRNNEIGEDGKARRKSKKYSSKKLKW